MSEGEEKALVPDLRFPEFLGKGNWSTEELGGKTRKVGSGITPKGGDKNYKSKGRPFVRSQNVGWGSLILEDVVYIDDETHATFSATEIKIGDVFLNITGASIGRSAIANKKVEGGNVNQHVCIIRVKDKELNAKYLNQFLISDAGQKQIDSFQAGGNRQGLNFGQISSFLIPCPLALSEQQKIADCLSSIDELITAQNQKLEALQAHKKGLMQQLFPAEGETVPQFRFPKFQSDSRWKAGKIKDFIASHKGGASLTPKDFSKIPDFQVIPKKAIGASAWINIEADKPTYCSKDFFEKNSQSIIDDSYLITTLRDLVPSGPSIGYIVKYKGQKKYLLAQGVYGLKPRSGVCSDFLIYFSNTVHYRRLVNSIMVGSTQVHIRNGDFMNLPIQFPKLEEQRKIADCLSSIDELITTQSQKIDSLKAHKKGLMQQVFPATDET